MKLKIFCQVCDKQLDIQDPEISAYFVGEHGKVAYRCGQHSGL